MSYLNKPHMDIIASCRRLADHLLSYKTLHIQYNFMMDKEIQHRPPVWTKTLGAGIARNGRGDTGVQRES
jgi:hypothetical protein